MVLALLPGAALWVLARCGSFEGAASFWPKAAALATLVVVASLGARWWRDPLRLGTGTGWVASASAAVAWLLVAVASVSMAMSPVARAGYVLVATLPFLLLVPGAVARLWVNRRARGVGLCGVAGALALVAGESLVRQVVEQHERAAMPLGHHNLLALWLLLLLPLPASLIALREQQTSRSRTRQGEGGDPRGVFTIAIAWLALLLGTAALFATGSLAGAVGLVVEAAVAVVLLGARMPRRVRRILVAIVPALLLAIAVWQGPRLVDVASGSDPSLRARAAYGAAGVRGFSERPLLGWGPGASSWLLHEHLRPVPGAHPAYEVVTDVHSLPLEVLYEGGVALALALVAMMVLYARARWRELAAVASRERAIDGWLALVGLAGAATAATASGAFDLPALAFAAAVVAGAAMTHAPPRPETSPWSRRGWPLWAITAGALLLLVPDLRGHWHYQRALALSGGTELVHAFREMERASRADPWFPLYPMRLTLPPFSAHDPARAIDAARLAHGVGPFWLRAGAVNGESSDSEPRLLQRRVLARACDLEPFGGLAPFLLARLATGDRAAQLLARALVAEPRLAASPWIERALLERALRAIEQVEEWPIGWRAAAVDRLRGLEVAAKSLDEDTAAGSRDELLDLVLAMDAEGSTSLSLFVFRRTPWSAVLVSIPLRAETARSIELPPLWSLPEVPEPRWARACGWLERPEP